MAFAHHSRFAVGGCGDRHTNIGLLLYSSAGSNFHIRTLTVESLDALFRRPVLRELLTIGT